MVWKFLLMSGIAFLLGLGMGFSQADERSSLDDSIKREIASSYPGATIELYGPIRWMKGSLPATVSQIRFLGENGRGEAQIQIKGVVDDQDVASVTISEAMIPFAAHLPAHVAARRIMPGEKIDASLFFKKDVDVARGQARELRGLILPAAAHLEGLESRQTILEGQFLTTSAIQRTPDVRRGDTVSIHVISGGAVVNIMGTVEEPAYLDGQVKVLAIKTKRQLVGQLKSGSVVEVSL